MQHSERNEDMRQAGLKKLERFQQDKRNAGTQPAESGGAKKQSSNDNGKGVRHGPENVDPQVAGNRRPLAQHSRFRPGAAKPDLPRSQANLPAPSVLIKQLEAGGAAAELPEDASDRLEAYHDALEALAASSAVGDGASQLEEEMESLKRQLADARAGEDKQRAELQVAHRQTDAVAQLRGMQERLDALEADLVKEREDKAAVKEASAKAVTAAKQHAADMSRDLEAVHDELEDQQKLKQEADRAHKLAADLGDELASAQERMQQMQAELRGVKDTAREQLLELVQLKATVAELPGQRPHPDREEQAQQTDAAKELKKAERLSKRMELRLKESEEKVSDLDARASIAKQRIAILERELETSRDMQKDLQSELAAARAQAAADRQQLQSKVDKLSEALRSSQKQAKQADAEAQEMEKAFRVLQTEMAEMGRKIASDMTAATGAQASVEAQAAAAADRAKLEHRLAQLSAEMEAQQQSAGAERKDLEQELNKARSEANALRSHGEQTGGAMQARDKEISSLKAQLQDMKRQGESRMAKVRAELSAVRSEAAARMRDLEGQLAEARASPPWRRAGAQAEAASADANRAALAATEAEISGLHAALQEAQQALSGASASLDNVQAQRDAAVNARAAAEHALVALQQQHEAAVRARQVSEQTLQALQERCIAAEAAAAAQEQALADLQARLEAAENAHLAALQAGEEDVKQLLAAVNDVEGDKDIAEEEARRQRQLCIAAQEAQAAAEAAAEALRQQLEQAQHDVEDASRLSKNQCDSLANQLAEAEAAKAEADTAAHREASELQGRLDSLQEDLKSAQSRVQQLETRMAEQLAEAASAKAEADAAANAKALELQGRLEPLSKELQVAQSRVQQHEAESAAAAGRETDLAAKLTAAQAVEASLRSSLETAGIAGAKHEAEEQALRAELAAHEQTIHVLTADLEKTEQAQAEANAEAAELRVKLASVQQDIESQRMSHAGEAEQLQAQIGILQGKLAAAEEAAAAAEAATESTEAQRAALERSMHLAGDRMREQQGKSEVLSSQLQEAQAAAFDAQRKLHEQVHELQAKQQALQGDIGAQVDHAVEQIQAVEHAAAQEQVAAITQELQETQALVAQSQEHLSAAEAAHKNEREAGLGELDLMRTLLQNAEAESARLLTQCAELEASLNAAELEKDGAIIVASERAAHSASQIASLEGTMADLQERLAQAEATLSASAEAQAQLQADRDELAAALAQTADALQKSESTLRELQDTHSTLATAHERCSELEAALQASADAQAKLQAARDELGTEFAHAAYDLEASKMALGKLQGEQTALLAAHERCAASEASLRTSADAQAQLQADRDELAASLAETADALSELQETHSALLSLHERTAASEASLSAAAEVHAQLASDRDELAASLEETAAALQGSEAAKGELQTRHDALADSAHKHEQHITQLTAQVDDLRQKLSEAGTSQKEACQQLTAQAAAELQHSQDQGTDLQGQVQSLEQALSEKVAQLTSAAELHSSGTVQLKGHVKELQQKNESLEGACKDAREQMTILEAELKASTEEVARSNEALSSTNQELFAKQALLQERTARVQELEGSLVMLEAQQASMKEAAESQHAEAESVQNELAESKQALEAARSEVECLREMVTSWEEAFGKAQLELDSLKPAKAEDADAEGLRVKLRAAVKKGKAIERQHADLEAQLSALQAQMEATEHAHANEVAAMKTRLSDVSAELATLEAQHAAAQQASSERDATQASAIAALQEQLHKSREMLTYVEEAAEASLQADAAGSAALAAAREELAALRLETEGLRSTLHAKEDELQQQAAQADTWESECLGAQIRADTAQKKLQEFGAQVLDAQKLAAELREQLKEKHSAQSHAEAAQQELTRAQQQLQLLQQSHQDLSGKFKESSSRCAQLQDELRSQTGRITELDAHLSRETGAAAAARESQEQLRGANMQLGLQLERLQQKLGAEQIARGEAEALYDELLASMAAAEDRAEVAEESMARLQQLQERRHANSTAGGGNIPAESEHHSDRQTPAEESADKAAALESEEGLKEAVAADVSVAVGLLAKAEQCATDVLTRLGQSHSMARLLEGQAASVAAQLPEMQEVVSCAMRLDCQVAALSEGVVRRQIEFDEKAQSLSAMAAAQIEAMQVEQQGLRKELESAEEDKEALQQRLLDSDIHAPSPAPSAPATGTPLATPLPSGQGLMQRTAGAQISASRLSREGPDADVELGFLDEDQASPSMLDAFTPHSSRLSSELRPLASVPLLQHAPAPAVTVAAHVDRMTSASMRWLQVHPLSRLGIMAYLFVMHVLLVLCSFTGRHGPVP